MMWLRICVGVVILGSLTGGVIQIFWWPGDHTYVNTIG